MQTVLKLIYNATFGNPHGGIKKKIIIGDMGGQKGCNLSPITFKMEQSLVLFGLIIGTFVISKQIN